eukprot:11172315-Lingulodinium_polyedra.AAC.1
MGTTALLVPGAVAVTSQEACGLAQSVSVRWFTAVVFSAAIVPPRPLVVFLTYGMCPHLCCARLLAVDGMPVGSGV